jgi:hypothetical protein
VCEVSRTDSVTLMGGGPQCGVGGFLTVVLETAFTINDPY